MTPIEPVVRYTAPCPHGARHGPKRSGHLVLVEVELTSELQKDLASLETLSVLRHAVAISNDPRMLALKTLTIGGAVLNE